MIRKTRSRKQVDNGRFGAERLKRSRSASVIACGESVPRNSLFLKILRVTGALRWRGACTFTAGELGRCSIFGWAWTKCHWFLPDHWEGLAPVAATSPASIESCYTVVTCSRPSHFLLPRKLGGNRLEPESPGPRSESLLSPLGLQSKTQLASRPHEAASVPQRRALLHTPWLSRRLRSNRTKQCQNWSRLRHAPP